MLPLSLCVLTSLVLLMPNQGKPRVWTAPETFSAKAEMRSDATAGAAPLTVQIDRYTTDAVRAVMEGSLKTGGYAGFLQALRMTPAAGYVEIGDRKFTIRWAKQAPEGEGRVITVVTDAPIYFVGAGRPDAKPKAGYEVAVLQLKMDSSGIGEGSMTAAARVKAGGPTGVQVNQYEDQPIKLVSVRRAIK